MMTIKEDTFKRLEKVCRERGFKIFFNSYLKDGNIIYIVLLKIIIIGDYVDNENISILANISM